MKVDGIHNSVSTHFITGGQTSLLAILVKTGLLKLELTLFIAIEGPLVGPII